MSPCSVASSWGKSLGLPGWNGWRQPATELCRAPIKKAQNKHLWCFSWATTSSCTMAWRMSPTYGANILLGIPWSPGLWLSREKMWASERYNETSIQWEGKGLCFCLALMQAMDCRMRSWHRLQTGARAWSWVLLAANGDLSLPDLSPVSEADIQFGKEQVMFFGKPISFWCISGYIILFHFFCPSFLFLLSLLAAVGFCAACSWGCWKKVAIVAGTSGSVKALVMAGANSLADTCTVNLVPKCWFTLLSDPQIESDCSSTYTVMHLQPGKDGKWMSADMSETRVFWSLLQRAFL